MTASVTTSLNGSDQAAWFADERGFATKGKPARDMVRRCPGAGLQAARATADGALAAGRRTSSTEHGSVLDAPLQIGLDELLDDGTGRICPELLTPATYFVGR